MKKIRILLTVMTVILMLMLTVNAEKNGFSSDKWRFNDFVGIMSEEDEELLIERAQEIIERMKCDFPVCIFDTLDDTMRLDEFSDRFYETNNFGYGEKKDGVLLVVDLKNNAFEILLFGEPKWQMSQETYRKLVDSFRENYSDESKSGFEIFARYYEDAAKAVEYSRENPVKRALKEDGMPYWYPDDPEKFVRFHGKNNEPVTDNAGIFTASQVMELTETAGEMKSRLKCDFVVFTDSDTHGIDAEQYAGEFFTYSGYGFGNGYKGIVIFLCTEHGKNGCYVSLSGSVAGCADAEELKSAKRTAGEKLAAGDPYGAVKAVLAAFDDLLRLPPWYPEWIDDIFTVDREKRTELSDLDPDRQRIADRAGLFDVNELGSLAERTEKFASATGIELLILTDTTSSGLSCENYASDYRYFNGYPENCAVLFIRVFEGKKTWTQIGSGSAAVVSEYDGEFAEQIGTLIERGDYAEAAAKYAGLAEYLLLHGRFMPEKAFFGGIVVGTLLLCAAAAAGVTVFIFRKRGKTEEREE